MYKAVLFDLDGTLIDFDACEINALKNAFRGVGFDVDTEATWARIWRAYAPISASYWRRRDREGYSRDQVMAFTMHNTLAALREDKGQAPALAPALAAAYWDAFCRTACLNPGAREILERLSPHFELGLVTNGDSDAQRGRLRAAAIEVYFGSIVISDEVGYAKPAREIFDIALSELGITAQEALFVGDSIEHDYHGAQNAGIDFCYYQPDQEMHTEIEFAFRASCFEELAHILYAP